MLKKIIKLTLPNSAFQALARVKSKYFDKYYQKSYSQEGEDMVLKRLFENQKVGFYVDVGAHHPKRFSNTYFFYKQGWRGVNIDAMPDSMLLFKKTRPRDINIEKPVSDRKQVLTYYAFNEPALNGFSKEISAERDGRNDYYLEFTKDIETSTLEEILDSNLPENQTIDFLSIDVEGLDLEVLKSNNFNRHRPKVILVEVLGSKFCDIEEGEIAKLLMKHNYAVYAKTIFTVIFIDNDYYDEKFAKLN